MILSFKKTTSTFLSLSISLACAMGGVACASPSEPESAGTGSASELTSAHWQTVLTCGNGGIVIDVDTHERRHLQPVIRDRGAVDYLVAHQPTFRLSETTVNAFFANDQHELVFEASVDSGVFSPGDFASFTVHHENWAAAHVERLGAGVKLRVNDEFQGHDTAERANWFFGDCR